jgi:hypothetical protein
MKYLMSALLGCLLLAGSTGSREESPVAVSLIQIIANPEKFDGKLVSVQGLLAMGKPPYHYGEQPILYMHEEDGRNLLTSNSVRVVASSQMVHDREKLNLIYVVLTGVFRAPHAAQNSYADDTITEVRSCIPYSNPNRPIGLRDTTGREPN